MKKFLAVYIGTPDALELSSTIRLGSSLLAGQSFARPNSKNRPAGSDGASVH